MEYASFPTFRDWQAQANGHAAFDQAARKFAQLAEAERTKACELATRTAAVDTNAIEGIYNTDRGFTRTVAGMAHGWEEKLAARGDHARPAFDDSMAGYTMVLDLATGRKPVTEAFVRELHAVMVASQRYFEVLTNVGIQKQQLPKGKYTSHPNSPTRRDGTVHAYCPPEDVPHEMRRLVEQCRSDDFGNAHPVEQASYIHYAFVCIHPFADGNGRVSRALASVYLYRYPGVPFMVFSDQLTHYIDALEAADAGNYRRFMDFVERTAIDAMVDATEELRSAPALSDILKTPPAQHRNVSALRIGDAAFTALDSEARHAAGSDAWIDISVFQQQASIPTREGYEPFLENETKPFVMLRSKRDNRMVAIHAAVLRNVSAPEGAPAYVLAADFQKGGLLDLHEDIVINAWDIEPVMTGRLQERIDRWARNVLGRAGALMVTE